jgi:Xaa-Pro aminopeptidase
MALNGNAEIFRRRRAHLLRSIGEGAVAILPSAPVSVRSNDVEFIYRQDSDFYYLTGFAEAESIAVLRQDIRKASS